MTSAGKNLPILLIVTLFLAVSLVSVIRSQLESQTGIDDLSPIKVKFNQLSISHTNLCAGPSFISSKSDNDRLQGSCCSPMDFKAYVSQINGLKKFADIPQIPTDPYDIKVSLARELLGYQQSITLNESQQQTYQEAVQISSEHGPCCCKCWRYDAFEGLAKFLITKHNFTAGEVAQAWDLVDGCGGPQNESPPGGV